MKKLSVLLGIVFLVVSCSEEGDDSYQSPPPTGEARVVISEVRYLTGSVELFNSGDATVNLENYYFCYGPGSYFRLGDLNSQGNLNLAPNQYVVLESGESRSAAGLGLYINNVAFGDAANIVDFVQWGSAGSPRENVAVTAGIWTEGEFVAVSGSADNSIAFLGNGNSAQAWSETSTITLGQTNVFTEPVQPSNVFISEVGYINGEVELVNKGNVATDVSDYYLCLGPGTYRRIGDLETAGDLVIEGGDYLEVTYELINSESGQIDGQPGTGGLGLYLNNDGFANPDNMVSFVQWGAGGSARENVAASADLWTSGEYIEVINNPYTSIANNGNDLPGSSANWSETVQTTFGSDNVFEDPIVSLVFNEIEFRGDQVELLNTGNVKLNISEYQICLGPGGTYRAIEDLPKSGDSVVEPGEYLVVTYDQINNGSGLINGQEGTGGLGLWEDGSDFTESSTLVDFVQWGAGGSPRENVAVEAGIWTAGDFIEVSNSNTNTLIYDGEGDASSDWSETSTPTLGDANQATEPEVASVIINELEYLQTDQVELYNNGNIELDLSGYWLCLGPGAYFRLGDATATEVVSGNLTLQPGQFLVVSPSSIEINNLNGGLGLYVDSSFTSSESIRSFVQWGSAGSARENVAAAAGLWTTGDFVPNVQAGSSIAYDGDGNQASDWEEATSPSLGSSNNSQSQNNNSGNYNY